MSSVCRLYLEVETGPQLEGCLSEQERTAAFGMKDSEASLQFMMRRSGLRQALSRELNRDPRDFEFLAGRGQKPRLASDKLEFSVSSTRGLALIAISPSRAVGVDVEAVDADFDYSPLLDDHFSSPEQCVLKEGDPVARCLAFFQMWTIKEAIAKACGRGIGASLREFDTLSPSNALEVATLPLPPGFVGALAVS